MTSRNRLRLMPLCLLLCAASLCAQTKPDIGRYTSGNLPSSRLNAPGVAGLCLQTDGNGGVTLSACSAGGGSGTVTTFSAGNLSPLFTVSVTNPTTTPSLAFTLSNFAAHSFMGNNTGSPAAPSVFQAKSTDLVDFSPTAPTTSGKIPIFDQPSGTYIPGDPLVQGLVGDGSTTAENPVAIGGYDTAGTPALHRSTFINGTPGGTEYGLVTRNVPSGTQAISVATLPLPAGASTSAKQPALGTAGTPSADVITVQGAASMTAVKTDGSAVTQPVSGTVTANVGTTNGLALDASVTGLEVSQGSTTSGQKGVLVQGAVTTAAPTDTTAQTAPLSLTPAGALRTDASATTQPVSCTSGTCTVTLVSGQQIKITDGTNVPAVKAASTAAVAADPALVTQISPNQPQLTTPLNIQGAKTNNNAAPGATNVGTFPAVANAAPPSYTEGNQTALHMDLHGNLLVNNHPPDALGCYQVNMRTSTYAGLAAGTPLLSIRWGDATHLMVINHIRVNVITTVAATTAGQAEREIIIARSFTASDTGGTAITLTGNNQKMRTSFSTSLVTDMRVGTTISAGTRTLDANPVASAIAWLPLNMTGVDIGCNGAGPTSAVWSCVSSSGYVDLVNAGNGTDYPIVLAQNEGVIGRIGKDAMPSGATQQTYWQVGYCEVNAF